MPTAAEELADAKKFYARIKNTYYKAIDDPDSFYSMDTGEGRLQGKNRSLRELREDMESARKRVQQCTQKARGTGIIATRLVR